MSTQSDPKSDTSKGVFEPASEGKQHSLGHEFLLFIVENKAWWMIPIVVAIALVGLLVVLGSTGAAPFIYTLF